MPACIDLCFASTHIQKNSLSPHSGNHLTVLRHPYWYAACCYSAQLLMYLPQSESSGQSLLDRLSLTFVKAQVSQRVLQLFSDTCLSICFPAASHSLSMVTARAHEHEQKLHCSLIGIPACNSQQTVSSDLCQHHSSMHHCRHTCSKEVALRLSLLSLEIPAAQT